METTIRKPQWHTVNITGRWRLIYKVRNSQGPEAFGGKHLGLYKSPFDGTTVYRRSVDNKPLSGFMMDRLGIDLFPDTNSDHKLLINWLICHNEVNVEGVKDLDEKIIKSKIDNRVFLKCLDYIEMEEIDEEDYIDRVIGRLSLEGGKMSIGLDKLKHIMASLGLPYSDPRFTGQAEKKSLRTKLKRFTRNSIDNAKKVSEAILNLDESKSLFNFKEMVRLNVLEDYGGLYKFNNIPVGTSYEKVQSFFVDHPEIKSEALEKLYSMIK